MTRVFGIHSVSPAIEMEKENFEAICEQAAKMMSEKTGTFKVFGRRSDKRYPLDSPAIMREAGGYILEHVPEWIKKYGTNSAYFCTNDAHTEPLLKMLLEHGGYFIEASGESLEGILPVLTDHCQTISCFGDVKENLSQLIEESGVKGCDRIVSFGQTLDFDLIWDGHDLIETMSRKITIK